MTDTTRGVERSFLVLGSHRAGTSVITRMLQCLGLYLGEERALLGPIQNDNELGFYEHEAIMRVSDQLLVRLGGTWREPPALGTGWEIDPALDDLREEGRRLISQSFAGRPLWGFKDPRLSITLPFWRTVTNPTAYVIVHRCPLDVARSLERRNGIALEHGVALSTYYTACAITATASRPRLFVSYEQLFTAPEQTAATLAAWLEISDPPPPAHVTEAVEPTLRHHAAASQELDAHPALTSEARGLVELLRDPVQSNELESAAARIVELGPPRETSSRRAGSGRHFGPRPLTVVAMLQVFNEQRFLAVCLEHLRQQGVGVYVIDNESTDRTLEIAQRYLGSGVIGIETLPRQDCFALREQCRRQEELAMTLDADWLIHHDADEIRVSPKRGQTLAEAITEFDAAGFNAVNFTEFVFVATREFPDHGHPRFAQTMRWYYPFLPSFPHRCNAWKRQEGAVDLITHAGHRVTFPGLKMAPDSLYMRHYLYISRQHAIEKFVRRRFAEDEVADGWFGWRAGLRSEMIQLPSVSQLRPYIADHLLDPSEPLERHLLDQRAAPTLTAPLS